VTKDPSRSGSGTSGPRVCLVAARFNQKWVERLVQGARDVLRAQGVAESDLDTIWVPGSLELPLACQWAAASGRYAAVIAFGVVLRGETEHFRLVADVSAHGLNRVALDHGVPVLNAVLAALNPQQVEDRAGGRMGNKGAEAALAALEMVRLRAAVAS
jgi:6,7-dimethyl-8-ribityllumazine synthase